MAKKITRQEIAENDLFGGIRQSAEETIAIIDKLSEALNETANAVKKSVGGAKFDSTKAIDNFVKSTEKANKLQKQAIELERAKANAVKARKQAMAANQKQLQEQEKTVQQRIRTEEALSKQKERANKAAERAARLAKQEASEYTKLVKKTRDLKNQSKELAAQMLKLEQSGKKNTSAYRELNRAYRSVTKEAKAGDATLKKIDSTVGDNFRNVGNYTGALKKLGGAMATLAGGFGIMKLLRGATDIVVNFDQAVADLGAISSQSTEEELNALTAQAKELGATTQFSATQITEMQIELAKLGFTADQIQDSTAGVANFAAATGADIPAAAALAGSALRGFGLEASEMERVVSTLGVATTKSALDFEKLNAGLAGVAPVANAFGFSIEDTTALLGQLANAGFDASSASTATKNILLNLADSSGKLAQELQKPIANIEDFAKGMGMTVEEAEQLQENLKNPIKTADDLAIRLKVLENNGVDLAGALELTDRRSVAAFQTFINGADDLVELRDSITDVNDELEDMAEKKLDTIGGQFTLLQSAWEGFVLSVNEGSGVGNAIKTALGFLAENLTTIMSVIGKAVVAWGAYQAIIISVAAKNFLLSGGLKSTITTLGNTVAGLFKMGKAAKTAGTGLTAMGKGMKSIPFVAIIALVVELATAMWDLAAGTAEKRRQDELLANAAEQGAAQAKIVDEGVQKRLKERFKAIDLLQAKNKITAQQAAQMKKDEVEESIRDVKRVKSRLDNIVQEEKAKQKAWKAELARQEAINKAGSLSIKEGGTMEARKAAAAARTRIASLNASMEKSTATVAEAEAANKNLDSTLEGLVDSSDAYNIEIEREVTNLGQARAAAAAANKTQKEVNTTFKKSIDLLKEYNEFMAERRQLEEDINQIGQERVIQGIDDALQAEIEAQRRAAETTGEIDVDLAEELLAKKTELKKAAIEDERDFEVQELQIAFNERFEELQRGIDEEREALIAGAEGKADKIKEIEDNYRAEQIKLDLMRVEEQRNLELEGVKIHLEAKKEMEDIDRDAAVEQEALNDELIQLQINYANDQIKLKQDTAAKQKEIDDKALEDEKKMWQDRMDIANVATDVLTELADRRIAKLDKEIENARKQQDFLRDLAASGNIDAKESLAEQQRIEDEANRKKIQEEKLKAKIEFANTVFQTYGAKVQAGSDSPLADTVKDVSLLQQFIAQFTPTYKDGTEDTGTHGAGIDGQGGFHAILHPNERVLTKEQNKAIGGLSNDSLAKLAQDYQNGKIVHEGASQMGTGWDSGPIVKRLMSLEEVIKAKPEHDLRVEDVVTGAMTIVRETRRGNNVNYNRYKVKK